MTVHDPGDLKTNEEIRRIHMPVEIMKKRSDVVMFSFVVYVDNTNEELLRKKNINEPENRSASPPLRSVSAPITTSHASHHLKEMKWCENAEAIRMIQKSKSSVPLKVKQSHVESTSKHDGDNTNSKLSGNKKCTKPENPRASPPLGSDSASLSKSQASHSSEEMCENADVTEIIETQFLPLEVKETLEHRTSKSRDIMIYESESPFHDRVLMIDEAVWDTSFIGHSILEYMTFKLLDYHPNPEEVLVIGRCEGRIVKALLRHGVESVGVCDIDEGAAAQSKELYNLYHKYFPKLVQYLDDPIVFQIDGGFDCLENNVFDVIITHSSYKSPYDYPFSKQHFESVKSALKEGGIALLIVSGQSFMESIGYGDFVEHDVQLLCKQLFPAVKYFRFQNFLNNDHPSCLTRVLLCGLNQENDFMKLCQ